MAFTDLAVTKLTVYAAILHPSLAVSKVTTYAALTAPKLNISKLTAYAITLPPAMGVYSLTHVGQLQSRSLRFLFADGFDCYGTTNDLIGNYLSIAGHSLLAKASTAFNLGQGVFGSALSMNGVWTTGTNETTVYASILLKYNSTGASSSEIVAITLQDGSTNQVSVVWAGDGSITIRTGSSVGTILQTITAAFRINTWNTWQIGYTIDPSGSVEIRKNGVAFATISGNTRGGSNSYANRFLVTANSATWLIDDLFFSAGSWPGDPRAIQQVPNRDVVAQFSPGTSNFAAVDDLTEDGDATYVRSTGAGQEDLYGLTALASIPASIQGMQFYLCQRKSDTGTITGSLQVKSGSTEIQATTYNPYISYGFVQSFQDLDPNTGQAWTYAGVNAVLMGPKRLS